MLCDQTSISELNQMKCIADSLNPTGSRLENEISYEINGCILTWIANYSGSEHRFDCTNIIEIIDGYYKAEFYLDTRRIFEAPQLNDSYNDISHIELTGYVSDDSKAEIKNEHFDEQASSSKMDSISNASTEVDSINDTNVANPTQLTEAVPPEAKEPKQKNSEPKSTHSEKVKDKPVVNAQKKNMPPPVPLTSGFNLRSSKNKNLSTSNIYAKDSRTYNCYSRIHTKAEIPHTPEVKKRRYSKSEASKKKPEIEVRRGERVRKVSIFQDCYIPTSRNEWISEVFIGAHKENF